MLKNVFSHTILLLIFFLTTRFVYASTNNVGMVIYSKTKNTQSFQRFFYKNKYLTIIENISPHEIVVVPNNLSYLQNSTYLLNRCEALKKSINIHCKIIKDKETCCLDKVIQLPGEQAINELKKILQRVLKVTTINDIIVNDPGDRCKIIKTPNYHDTKTKNSITFKMNKILKPNECFYLSVPSELQDYPIEMVSLGHRQEPSYNKGGSSTEEDSPDYDNIPGMTSIHLHSKDYPDGSRWRYWGNPSQKKGAKYAEVGNTPEIDNLYRWPDIGHTGTRLSDHSKKLIKIDAIKVTSSGKDPVTVDAITLNFVPKKSKIVLEKKFTPRVSFGDSESGKGKSFGIKKKYVGKYPGAFSIGYRSSFKQPNLPSGWRFKDNSLLIPLGKINEVETIEVAIGDQHNDIENINSDGGYGTSGHARFSMGIKHQSGSITWFLIDQSVPPQGFFRNQAPRKYTPKKGDQIILKSSSDTTMLMGIKVGGK
ncbi:MAG: hypothetical protein HON90_01565 [Halobacteriovoraceae bacterium]|nr:hypothetical protein [Halobacteriovoraceae bacterium]